ncbi:U32 family peptidase [Hathewaya limosa]|uniref:Protease n=1 Tax=Hathewaya limosa TaxID=1536 RepID=A0ABU0JT79_HATLI|nr:U32 family peptidase [Hathewaya limosa]MDQ0479620.1 putative protease [Hathewaya limosa]
MKKIELLAPAGTMESLKAAVQSGADAIYLGGSKFSARAYATNFDDDTMKEAIEYCHFYGVKVYVTINTLLKEEELFEALEYANLLNNIGVDAVIIQDLGLAKLIKQHIKDLEIHASTQMTVHNGEGALYLKSKGFERIVLSRELSLEEIKYISKDLNIETEIFIHGALCISYSGQCLMSSIIGGRSGNRGRCAQPCRLPYKLINKKNNEEKQGYIMSPKDICTLDNIDKIIESGTSSLKIEGRMKRPEYVAGVVKAYRKAIDSYYENRKIDLKEDKNIVTQLFNREGFSKAYFFGNTGKDMMAYNFPKNTGVCLGEVNKDKSITLKDNLRIKDGVRIKDEGFIVNSILINGKEVQNASKGDKVIIKPLKYKKGDVLYKTSDNDLLENLSSYYKEIYRKYDLDLKVRFKVGEPIQIKSYFYDKVFEVEGEIVQKALNKPLDKEKIIKNLSKSGNTRFNINKVELPFFEEGFMPVSSLNNVRRELLDQIFSYIEERNNGVKDNKLNLKVITNEKVEINSMPKTLICVNTDEQLKATLESDIEYIAVNPFIKKNNLDINNIKNKKVYLKVPNIVKDKEWKYVCNIIDKYIEDIEGILTSNLGIIGTYKNRTKILVDYKINLFNSYAYEFLNDVEGIYISPELNKKDLRKTLDSIGKNNNLGILIYGRYELMISEYCPIGAFYGNKTEKKSCNNSCLNGEYYLKDRMGEEFLIITDKFCRSYVLNSSITNLISQNDELKSMGIKNYRIDFTDESYEICKRVLDVLQGNSKEIPELKFTKGHYKRGVE